MNDVSLVAILRAGLVESYHIGSVAIANARGELLAWHGDPQTTTFLRSSAKPFQALPLVESGAADRFGLSPQQIALTAASHSGTDRHARMAESILECCGCSEGDLRCGVHTPYDRETARALAAEGREPSPLQHNCSGKHAGMLTLAAFLGQPSETYLDPDQPVQQRILQTFLEMTGLSREQVTIGIDGCSAPNFAVPLHAAATAYARLMDPGEFPPSRQDACERIVQAMTANPELVSGEGRFDTELMRATGGGILSKGGAEGFQGLGIPAGGLGVESPALGVAIKISDGDAARRATSLTALAVLKEIGALDEQGASQLASFDERELHNYRGLTVGEIRSRLALNVDGFERV